MSPRCHHPLEPLRPRDATAPWCHHVPTVSLWCHHPYGALVSLKCHHPHGALVSPKCHHVPMEPPPHGATVAPKCHQPPSATLRPSHPFQRGPWGGGHVPPVCPHACPRVIKAIASAPCSHFGVRRGLLGFGVEDLKTPEGTRVAPKGTGGASGGGNGDPQAAVVGTGDTSGPIRGTGTLVGTDVTQETPPPPTPGQK